VTAPDSLPLHALTVENLASASPDLLRQMVKTVVDALMSADANAACNAAYGQVSEDGVNQRNGYRPREWTRVQTRSSWRSRRSDPAATSGLAAGTLPPRRISPHLGGRHRLQDPPATALPRRNPAGAPSPPPPVTEPRPPSLTGREHEVSA
jgi:hypothetical protein